MQLELGGGSTKFEVRRLSVGQGTSSDPRLEGRRGGGTSCSMPASLSCRWTGV
jgi:hypothetical protein